MPSERLTPKQAREQAAEAQGFLASKSIWIGEEEFEIPQRGLMDDEQRERLNELEIESESWDRHPDVTIGGRTRPGDLKMPYRKNGKPIKPGYPARVAIALWGEEKWRRYLAGKGRSSDVTAILAELDIKASQRERDDSKSVASGGDVDAGTEPD